MKKLLLLACTFLCAFSFYAQTLEVQSFTLIDADTNTDILPLEDGRVYNADEISTGVRLNIRANADGVGSVDMKLRGALNKNRTETSAPYALYGDNNGNYFGTNFPLGAYTLTATPYSGPGATGTPGEPLEVNFTFALQPTAVASVNILSGEAPLEVQFTGSNSQNENPDNSLEYLWNFGDGTTATEADPTHVFQNSGTYTVQLTTTNVYGFSDMAALEIVVNEPVNVQRPFVTRWLPTIQGRSGNGKISIPTFPEETYNYTVDWGDGTSDSNVTGDITHTYIDPDSFYTVSITGQFPRIYFNNPFNFRLGDNNKIYAIEQWGDIQWTSMENAFAGCNELDVTAIDTPNLTGVTELRSMFVDCTVLEGNEAFENWNTSTITNMSAMFANTDRFNQDIVGWDVGNVTNMLGMFLEASMFNQDISNWNVSKVTNMSSMFSQAFVFNQDLNTWDVSMVTNMRGMFFNATSFDQNLGGWNVGNVENMDSMFTNSILSIENYDALLNGWSNLPLLQSNVIFDGGNSQYCLGEDARQNLIDTYGWTITDGEKNCVERPFITTWKTDNQGQLGERNDQISILTHPSETYNYNVDWGDGTIENGLTRIGSHIYATPGTYTVSITGQFPRIYSQLRSGSGKLLTVEQWGDIKWSSMEGAFTRATNLDIVVTDIPDLSNVTSFRDAFIGCSNLKGNSSMNDWDVSNVTNMTNTFQNASSFNQNIGSWDVSKVTGMSQMFRGAEEFNQPIGNWVVENVESMGGMFQDAINFNQDISTWSTSNVGSFRFTFSGASLFNQNIANWNTSSAQDMVAMFQNASSFNQDIGDWDVSKVFRMDGMFEDAVSFDQNLGSWNIGNVAAMTQMFKGIILSLDNYDSLLQGWGNLPSLKPNIFFNGGNSQYCLGEDARQNLIDTYGWTITDGGLNCPDRPFITTWKTDNPGISADNQITIPTLFSETYNYNVDWGDGTSNTGVTAAIRHTYASPGTYTVTITGDFPQIHFGFTNPSFDRDRQKILTVEQWGTTKWADMDFAFVDCINLDIVATDVPDLSNTVSVNNMFRGCTSLVGNASFSNWNTNNITNAFLMFANASLFNQDISGWDVSNVQNMASMFSGATSFNQDISNWNVNSVFDMNRMFQGAIAFNQDISPWNVGFVSDFNSMFSGATAFNQNIGNWDVSNANDMTAMFRNATVFNQDISSWNVSGVTRISSMFSNASSFNQNLGSWDVGNVFQMINMLNGTSLSIENYDATLNGWAALPSLKNDVRFSAGDTPYCFGEEARQSLIDTYEWEIEDGGLNCPLGPRIESFIFVAVDSNLPESSFDAFEIEDGMAYDIDLITGFAGNIRANTNPEQAGSVVFSLSGALSQTQTENVAPYALYGDVSGVYNNTTFFLPGTYTLTAIAYTERNGAGEAGFENTVNFTLGFKPTATASADVLEGDAPLTVNFTGSNSQDQVEITEYLWDFGDGTTSSEADPTHIYENIGTFDATLTVKNAAGLTDTTTLSVEVFPLVANGFVTTWKTDNPGASADNQITIPTLSSETYDYTIEWGDGNIDTNVTGNMTHTYSSPGTYTVVISGVFPRIIFSNAGDKEKILTIEQWGDIEWTSMGSAFKECINLDMVATDLPDLSRVTVIRSMFESCTSLIGNSSINNWDLTNVTTINSVFRKASAFNQDISNWDVGNVVNFGSLFASATSFNHDIGGWNVSSGFNFAGMFFEATVFNQDIGAWDLSFATNTSFMFFEATSFNQDIGNWSMGRLQNMNTMFFGASAFNQDISRWDVSNVTDMSSAFRNATLFNQNLGSWDIGSVEQISGLFTNSALSDENYDGILIGWASLPSLQPNVGISVQNQYCEGEMARQFIIDTYGWNIFDEGLNCPDATIEDFTLINSIDDTDLLVIEDGAILDRTTDLNSASLLNIRANANMDFSGSFVFSLSGGLDFNQTESVAPYALFGDRGGDYAGMDLPIGSYNLMVTAYSGLSGTGDIVETKTINFTITNQTTQKAPYEVSLSPNAAITEVNVIVSDASVEVVNIVLYDMHGRMVASFEAPQVQNNTGYQLPVSSLSAGTYILTTIDNKGIVNQERLLIRK